MIEIYETSTRSDAGALSDKDGELSTVARGRTPARRLLIMSAGSTTVAAASRQYVPPGLGRASMSD